jgi:phage terminase small subunit
MAGNNDTLTPFQAAFVKSILEGNTQAQAYRLAGYAPCDPQQTAVKASQLAALPKVRAAIDEGKARLAEEELLSRREAVAALARIAKRKGRDRNATARDVIGAVAQASKMLGYDAPTKVDVKLEGSLLHRIRSRGGSS